jgi:hypothetical protein
LVQTILWPFAAKTVDVVGKDVVLEKTGVPELALQSAVALENARVAENAGVLEIVPLGKAVPERIVRLG